MAKITARLLALALTLGSGGLALGQSTLVELFTSQGCSSCPPADALLARLAEEPGVVALSFHVDYWDYLGWRDPYASPAFSERQRRYARALGDRVYTPQVVVNGTASLVGSREPQVRAAIDRAKTRQASVQITIEETARRNHSLSVRYALSNAPAAGLVVNLAVAEEGAANPVKAGENRGRRLRHVNVVRVFHTRSAGASPAWTAELPAELKGKTVRLAIYAQDEKTLAVKGLATALIPPS